MALHLAPAHVLAELLGDLGQPDLAGGVLLAALLLPGRVPALQLAPLGPLHPRLEAGHQVGAGSAGGQLGCGLASLLLGRIQTLDQEEAAHDYYDGQSEHDGDEGRIRADDVEIEGDLVSGSVLCLNQRNHR